MISKVELNPKNVLLTPEQAANLDHLYEVMNIVRAAYGKPMYVTSGIRSWDEHVDIYIRNGSIEYNQYNEIVVRRGRSFPTKSAHLMANACDIRDHDRRLWGWCMDELEFLAALGIYLEDGRATRGWVHFQTVAPKSGNRIFMP